MSGSKDTQVLSEWRSFEDTYRSVQTQIQAFVTEAGVVGVAMISDVPVRLEYMKMIRAEADDMLAYARKNREAAKIIFDRIYDRRNEMRLIQQSKASAVINILSKLKTKNPGKYQLLVRAADKLAQAGQIPAAGNTMKSIPLESLSQDQLDDVFLKAIDGAGGSRKSITPKGMRMQGAGLLILTVALAGLDIYLSEDKSFAVSKNVSTIAAGAGGAWGAAAVGLALGGPVGGLIGLVVGGVAGSMAGEEIHFRVRGLNVNADMDSLVSQHYGVFNFDEGGLARAIHTKFLGDMRLIYVMFSHLNEKRSSDADDVAVVYVDVARKICTEHPGGALVSAFKSSTGQGVLDLLQNILHSGWTSDKEYTHISWLKSMRAT